MYLLCKRGDDWYEWFALSCHGERETLDAEAHRLNVAEYDAERAAFLSGNRSGGMPLPLDDPRREGYRTYFVRQVPVWPQVDANSY